MSSDNAFELTGTASAYGGLLLGNDYQDLGTVAISTITEAPVGGYSHPSNIDLLAGHSYAFLLKDSTYGLLEVKSVTVVGIAVTMVFDYKYQPSGSRNFN